MCLPNAISEVRVPVFAWRRGCAGHGVETYNAQHAARRGDAARQGALVRGGRSVYSGDGYRCQPLDAAYTANVGEVHVASTARPASAASATNQDVAIQSRLVETAC